MHMNEKIKVNVTHLEMIGSKYLKNFYAQVKCDLTKQIFKSPVVYGKIESHQSLQQETIFWQFQLFESQNEIHLKLIQVSQTQQVIEILSQKLIKLKAQNLQIQDYRKQKQIYFLKQSKKIAILTYFIEKVYPDIILQKSSEYKSQTNQNRTFQNMRSYTYAHRLDQQSSQNDRFNADHTQYQSFINSMAQQNDLNFSNDKINFMQNLHNFTNNQILNKLEQSSILQRHPYIQEDSLLLNQDRSKFMITNQRQNCLKKWMKKLQKIQSTKKNIKKSQLFQTIVPQKYLKRQEQQNHSLAFQIQSIKLQDQLLDNFLLKGLTLKPLDDKTQASRVDQNVQPYYECNFASPEENINRKQPYSSNIKQLKFKKTVAYIPEDQHIQVKVSFQDTTNNSSIICQGIILKDKLTQQNKISLITADDKLFGTLDIKTKRVQNVSIQSLPKLDFLLENGINNSCQIGYERKQTQKSKLSQTQRKSIPFQAKIDYAQPHQIQLLKRKEPLAYALRNQQARKKQLDIQNLPKNSPFKGSLVDQRNSLSFDQKEFSSQENDNENQRQNYSNMQNTKSMQNYEFQSIKSMKNNFRQRKLNNSLAQKYQNAKLSNKKAQSLYKVDNNQSPRKQMLKTLQKNNDMSTLVNESIMSPTQSYSPPFDPLQRSNTDKVPYFKLDQQDDDKRSSVSRNLSKVRQNLQKIDSNRKYRINNSNKSPSPRKQLQEQQILRLQSIRKDSNQQTEGFNGNTFKVFQKSHSSFFVKKQSQSNNIKSRRKYTQIEEDMLLDHKKQESEFKLLHNVDDRFIIQINTITVIPYEKPFIEQQQNGKFLILKNDKQQSIITQTVYSSHLNLIWSDKNYQFKSSQIQLSLYEKIGKSTQSKNKFLGKVAVKFVDLVKCIKQNFYRTQLQYKNVKIATAIILYDIFMEKHHIGRRQEKSQASKHQDKYHIGRPQRKNVTQMKITQKINRLSRSLHKSDLPKHHMFLNQQLQPKMKTINTNKNRKRAKTFDVDTKHIMFPSISRNLSPSRKLKNYQGGKNIRIGRAQRFSNVNVAEVIGQI